MGRTDKNKFRGRKKIMVTPNLGNIAGSDLKIKVSSSASN